MYTNILPGQLAAQPSPAIKQKLSPDLVSTNDIVMIHGLALIILKIGLALTFLWMSLFIFRDPMNSAHLIQPWVLPLLPLPVETIMHEVTVLNICIGILFLTKRGLWFAALLAVSHLLLIFIITGVNSVTVRNIGLLGASSALLISVPPPTWVSVMLRRHNQ